MSDIKRYYVYDYLIGQHFLLIDTQTKELQFYNTNLYGQIYNLEKHERQKITPQKLNGLLKRLKNRTYSFENSYVIDKYLYEHFFTKQQKQETYKPFMFENVHNGLITSGNDFKKVLKDMAIKIYEASNNKINEQYLQYIDTELAKLD